MAHTVLMPQLGISEESAILTAWHVRKGETVKSGDKLFSLETGKSAFDVESEHTGTVLALLAEEGGEIAVKAPVCVVGEAGEQWPAYGPAPAAEAAPPEPAAPIAADVRGVSPRARRLAEKNDIDPASAAPTGPSGRVIERDVRAFVNARTENERAGITESITPAHDIQTVDYQDKPLSGIRKTIAKTMSASLAASAQLTHTASFDATRVLEYRGLLKNHPELNGVTLTDMVLYAVTRTLPAFPALNAWLMGDTMRVFSEVNLACAVDTERGLMVPVIFGASKKTLLEISRELKTLAEGCRGGGIDPKLLTGGSFTVSNLGQFGIESFTPILNPPQTGILGVNTITARVREAGGEIKTYPCMSLSLTYDHRALDGAPASKFLQTLCKNLESFTALLAG